MTAPRARDALFCLSTRGFNFATRKTNVDIPDKHFDNFLYRYTGKRLLPCSNKCTNKHKFT